MNHEMNKTHKRIRGIGFSEVIPSGAVQGTISGGRFTGAIRRRPLRPDGAARCQPRAERSGVSHVAPPWVTNQQEGEAL